MAQLPDSGSGSLSALSNQIRNETVAGANTCVRNGDMLQDIIDSKFSRVDDRPDISQGLWDASSNAVPALGALFDPVKAGYYWMNFNHTSTTLLGPDGDVIKPYCKLTALADTPGSDPANRNKWMITYY